MYKPNKGFKAKIQGCLVYAKVVCKSKLKAFKSLTGIIRNRWQTLPDNFNFASNTYLNCIFIPHLKLYDSKIISKKFTFKKTYSKL